MKQYDELVAFRAPKDVRRLISRALKDLPPTRGQKTNLILACLRKGLAKYAGKRESDAVDAAELISK